MKHQSTSVSRINLNTATSEELAKLPGIGPDKAWNIIQQRPFRSWTEVKEVPGFTAETVKILRTAGAVLDFNQDMSL